MTRRQTISHPPAKHPSPARAEQCDFGNLLFDKARTMISPEEIAAKLECSRTHVIHLIEGGDLGSINIGSGKIKFYRVPAAEWERFLRKRATV